LYDARLEDVFGDPSGWKPAVTMPSPRGLLALDRCRPIRVTRKIAPANITALPGDPVIVDMGVNMVGFCRLIVRGCAGDVVKMRFAERLDGSGELYTANLRSAEAADTYIIKGDGTEVWEPRFTTFHGFRYVELTGYPGTVGKDSLTGCIIHDDLDPAGSFSSSDPLLNRIDENILRGICINYWSISTDCHQRDERQGWLGGRAFGSRGESY